MLLLAAIVVPTSFLGPAAWTASRSPRAQPSASVSDPPTAKAALLALLPCETTPLPDEVKSHISDLASAAGTLASGDVWTGRFNLLACEPLGAALENACPRKSWYRGWLTRTTEVDLGKEVTGSTRPLSLELELDVMMALTGLRAEGEVELGAGQMDAIRLSLSTASFFEPCDEFGISKSIAKAEEELVPQFPSRLELAF